jgi:hypothetical protein
MVLAIIMVTAAKERRTRQKTLHEWNLHSQVVCETFFRKLTHDVAMNCKLCKRGVADTKIANQMLGHVWYKP